MDTQETEEIAARIAELVAKMAEVKRLAQQIEENVQATSEAE
ncbi:hypothetical protein [Streptomyces sp. NPDC058045]